MAIERVSSVDTGFYSLKRGRHVPPLEVTAVQIQYNYWHETGSSAATKSILTKGAERVRQAASTIGQRLHSFIW